MVAIMLVIACHAVLPALTISDFFSVFFLLLSRGSAFAVILLLTGFILDITAFAGYNTEYVKSLGGGTMKETNLVINCTISQLADVRTALAYAIDIAPTEDIKHDLQRTYVDFCNLILDAVEQE